jgi:hypothetical protein
LNRWLWFSVFRGRFLCGRKSPSFGELLSLNIM